MKKLLLIISSAVMLLAGCGNAGKGNGNHPDRKAGEAAPVEVMPITGTFINLIYQDVRNKYTNPQYMDNTDPQMWAAKIAEMKGMGMEYIVIMAVANEFKAYYPSKLLPWVYPLWRKSPVDAIMDAAAEHGMKVFMSTGWARNQDDNLRDPAVKGRYIYMLEELAGIYKDHPAFYGWYLPVEDCLGPVLTDYAVDAVNALTAKAREVTPDAKVLISPYGIFNSDFDDPRYEEQILKLEVDIIAYQDEIGCVRERYPLPRLRENWKKLRAIHDKTDIEMWANCESFAWEKGTNDRSSALIPAPYGRLLAQQAAASAGGVDKIISFMMCGIFDVPSSPYQLGQPYWSARAYEDYMSWKDGDRYWRLMEASLTGGLSGIGDFKVKDSSASGSEKLCDGKTAGEDVADEGWVSYRKGLNEIYMTFAEPVELKEVMVRLLNSCKDGVRPPAKMQLSATVDGINWILVQRKDAPVWPNTNHDAFVDCIHFDHLIIPMAGKERMKPKSIRLSFIADGEVCIDEIYVNPVMAE